jgi:double-strand break repair protein MRE11
MNAPEADLPLEALQAMEASTVKVSTLVKEYLNAQSLRIMPGAPFTDAIVQFVEKNDKFAVESFVEENLKTQFEAMMKVDDGTEELDPLMERVRKDQEKLFASGERKLTRKNGKLKPKPSGWESDVQGEWAEQPGAYEYVEGEDDAENEEATTITTKKRGRAATTAVEDEDDNASLASTTAGRKAPAKKAPAKRAPAKPKAKAPAKSTANPTGRGRAKPFELSDEDEDEDADVMILDDPPPKPKAQPKRAAAVRGGRQTQLTFTQPSQSRSQAVRELSDDEIDDDDDAFEPMASSSSRRR